MRWFTILAALRTLHCVLLGTRAGRLILHQLDFCKGGLRPGRLCSSDLMAHLTLWYLLQGMYWPLLGEMTFRFVPIPLLSPVKQSREFSYKI